MIKIIQGRCQKVLRPLWVVSKKRTKNPSKIPWKLGIPSFRKQNCFKGLARSLFYLEGTLRGAVHTKVTMQNVRLTLDVGVFVRWCRNDMSTFFTTTLIVILVGGWVINIKSLRCHLRIEGFSNLIQKGWKEQRANIRCTKWLFQTKCGIIICQGTTNFQIL